MNHHLDDCLNLLTKYVSHVGRNPGARLEQVTFGVRSRSSAKWPLSVLEIWRKAHRISTGSVNCCVKSVNLL